LTRLPDRLLGFLTRPRVGRVRRWSFVVTGPTAAFVAWRFGVQDAVALIALRVALFALVAWWAWRLPDERGEAVRDLLMHPRLRAFTRTEVDVWLTVPRLLGGAARRATPGMRYHRGTDDLAMALAFALPLLAEGTVVHLLLPSGWVLAQVANAALHLYAMAWLLAIGLGRRAWPHAVRGGALTIRNGALHRARIPLALVERAEPDRRRVAGERGLHVEDGVALLPARRRVDVRVVLREPVRIAGLGEPVWAREIAVASDDPEAFVRALAELPRPARPTLAAALAIGAYEALQPG
jgi:hypothetical protein